MIKQLLVSRWQWLKIFHPIWHNLFPSSCLLCSAPGDANLALCSACYVELPHLQNACYRCGQTLSPTAISGIECGHCLHHPPAFDRTLALFDYQAPLNRLITRLKFAADLKSAKLLGSLLAQRVQYVYQNTSIPELIIPMPLHYLRLRERGFNQSIELARPIAKLLNIPLQFTNCQRHYATLAQTQLPLAQRQKNVRHAFSIQDNLQGKYVAIVDDVVTSAATVNMLSQALCQAGATQIDVWCVARTQLGSR